MRRILHIFLSIWFVYIVFCVLKAELSSHTTNLDGVFVFVQMVLWLILVLLCIRHHFQKKTDKEDTDLFG